MEAGEKSKESEVVSEVILKVGDGFWCRMSDEKRPLVRCYLITFAR